MRVQRVLAPNPGIMTGPGTNTWVVSEAGRAMVVDPGPVIPGHLDAVYAAASAFDVVAVLVTHGHPDHAPGAAPLAQRLDAPTVGMGSSFSPDHSVADGEEIAFGDGAVLAVATPGHTADSVSYRYGDALFTGDHIMGGSTVMVEDMAAYMASLERVQTLGVSLIYPGHGPVIDDPGRVVDDYLDHRREREQQILEAVTRGATSVAEVVAAVYADVAVALHPAAAVSVDAHLRKLAAEERVHYPSPGGPDAPVEAV